MSEEYFDPLYPPEADIYTEQQLMEARSHLTPFMERLSGLWPLAEDAVIYSRANKTMYICYNAPEDEALVLSVSVLRLGDISQAMEVMLAVSASNDEEEEEEEE